MIYGLIAVLVLVGFLVMLSMMKNCSPISEDERAREDAKKYKREDN